MALRDDIFAIETPRKDVEIGPGITVLVFGWNGLEVDRWRQEIESKDFSRDYISATLFQRAARGPDGKLIFSAVDVPKLATKPSNVLQKVIKALNELNGFGEEETIRKNFSSPDLKETGGDSSSD